MVSSEPTWPTWQRPRKGTKDLTVNQERLTRIRHLRSGAGPEPNDDGEVDACVMQAVAYVSGEPWSDHPACVCPVLASFCISLNDSMPEAERQQLLVFVPRLGGTKS